MVETDVSRGDGLEMEYEINHPIAAHFAWLEQGARRLGRVVIEADDVVAAKFLSEQLYDARQWTCHADTIQPTLIATSRVA